jgi:hypothetical protein
VLSAESVKAMAMDSAMVMDLGSEPESASGLAPRPELGRVWLLDSAPEMALAKAQRSSTLRSSFLHSLRPEIKLSPGRTESEC